MSLHIHFGSVSSSQVQTVPVTLQVPRVSLSPRASLTNTPTTWSAPSSSLSPPAWMSPSPSSPLTWRTTPCRAGRGTASTTGWKCGTGSQEVSCWLIGCVLLWQHNDHQQMTMMLLVWEKKSCWSWSWAAMLNYSSAISGVNTQSKFKMVCILRCLHPFWLKWSSNYFSSYALVDESQAYRQDVGTYHGETT